MKILRGRKSIVSFALMLAFALAFLSVTQVSARIDVGPLDYRDYDVRDMGLSHPQGITYSPQENLFYTLHAKDDGLTHITSFTPYEAFVDLFEIAEELAAPTNVAFDSHTARLLVYNPTTQQLIALPTEEYGTFDDLSMVRYDASGLNLLSAGGMVVDPVGEFLYILDAGAREVVRVQADAAGNYEIAAPDTGRVTRIKLEIPASASPQGLAYDAAAGRFYTLDRAAHLLYELTSTGQVVETFALAAMALTNPLGLVIAPTADKSDDPALVSVFLTDSGLPAVDPQSTRPLVTLPEQFESRIYLPLANSGSNKGTGSGEQGPSRLIELSLTPGPDVSNAAVDAVARLVNTTDTSADFDPPSTDSSGITYIPGTNRLLMSDSEIEELPLYAGVNLWDVSLDGIAGETFTTMPFSDEPTDVAFAAARGPLNHDFVFISDDRGTRLVYVVDLGADGNYGTSDDLITSFSPGSPSDSDPEGVTYDSWNDRIVVVDGVDAEVFITDPGPNEVFGNADDTTTHFDVGAAPHSLNDPEGIGFDPVNGHLYILGRNHIAETLLNGTLVRIIDIDAIESSNIAGITKAPPSTFDPAHPNDIYLYIVDRGVDEGFDGKIYEIGVEPVATGQTAPVVNAGPDQNLVATVVANLDGTVTDDGLPSPPGNVTTTWSKVSGPGIVTFGNANLVDTTATFAEPGVYILRLFASDGALATFDEVSILVSLGHNPPTVNAGPDQIVEITTGATLNGTVSDDGLPTPPNLTRTWSKVSGPGTVTFGNAALEDTTASFSETGIYVLRLTANDGQLTTIDDITITVTLPSGTLILDRRVNTASDDAEERGGSQNGTVVLGSDLEMVFDQNANQTIGLRFNTIAIPMGATIVNAYIQFALDEATNVATTLTIQGHKIPNAPTFTTSNFNITNRPRTTASATWTPPAWTGAVNTAGAAQRTNNFAPVIQEIVGQAQWTSGNSLVIIISGTGERVAVAFEDGAANAPLLHIEYTTTPPVNQAPTVNAGADQGITLPAGATLDATVTDDGLPSASVTTNWSMTSGPGTVTFGNAGAVDTTAGFSAPGSYVLRLTANDGALQAFDEVSITVNPASPVNQAPTVNAGADQTITLPAGATLDATVTDDGLPSASVTTNWSMISGPGTVTFGNAGAVDTTAGFSTPGSYVLRLTANDGALQAFDEVSITVNPASPVNQAPTVNAGADQTITLPAGATLDATVTDDGLPSASVTTNWSMISGPGTVTFGNAGAVDTTAGFSTPGSYVLRLTANDGALQAFDEVTIVVSTGTGQVELSRRVAAGADDAEQNIATGAVDLTSSDLELAADGTILQLIGMRFTNMTIPAGATILSAYLQFKVDETSTGAATLSLQGQAADNAATFTSAVNNISSRPKTAATVAWQPPTWPTVGAITAAQLTPNLAAIIQEIVARPGWVSGNALAILLSGSGRRTAEAWNGDQAGAPLLIITYASAGGNQAPTVNAGADQGITLPAGATLDATVTDDGLPSASVTTNWSMTSGPGTVTFGNAGAVDTTAGFSAPGSYVLRLTANDGALQAFDEVSITVNPASPVNQAPTVNAGADQTITLPAGATLDATVTDDGLPSASVTTNWSMISGPGTVTFGNAGAVDTTARFSTPGSYVLRLTANDGALQAFDEVTIVVTTGTGQVELSRRVAAGADDAEQNIATGAVDLTSSDLELAADGTILQLVGMRFTNMTIPAGATILSAYLQFKVDETSSGTASLSLQGQAADNAATFTSAVNNISSRPKTAATVAWQPPTWPTVGAITPAQLTPNLAAIIQEIVARPGWVSGNALAILLSGSGRRTAEAWNGDQAGAPLLIITYTVPSASAPDPQTVWHLQLPMIITSSGSDDSP